ncbi:MAG TPA: WD40 repeat domain-containing protein, partial [Thermoanaerobaculia bacterium]|nr:WD40 repeat domain-containing protein [Thermoanaerobaculia bacterium]
FDDDGRLLTASWSGKAQVWRVPDGALLMSLVGHGEKVDRAEFSPNRKWILTAGRDGTARVWDARDGTMVTVLRGHRGMVVSAHFDGSSERIATTSESAASVWERATGRRTAVLEGHGGPVSDARFSPSGDRIVTRSWDGTAAVWAVEDAYQVARSPRPGGDCSFIGRSARESRFIVAPCSEGTSVWDIERGTAVADLPGAERAEVSADGKRAITASGSTATIWDLRAKKPLGRLEHRGRITAVDWSPSGGAALSAGEDGVLRIWREEGEPRELRGAPGALLAAAFMPDGGGAVTGDSNGTVRFVDLASGSETAKLKASGAVDAFRFSADGARMVALPQLGGGQPTLWDLARHTRIAELSGHVTAPADARFDRAGKRVVTAAGDDMVRLYDADTGAPLGLLSGSPQFLESAAFDATGTVVAATGGDGAIRFWDPATLNLLWVLDAHRVTGVELRFAADNRLVSRDWEGGIHVWRFDNRPIAVEELDRLLACRSPVRFDHGRRTIVAAVRPTTCR